MTEPLRPGSVIGILGGGQLGRMLAMAAARLSYRTVILEPEEDCPAGQLANLQICAAYDDPAAISRLAGLCDVVTYEFENVPVDTARQLSSEVAIYPPPVALEIAQDRLVEKDHLNRIGVPTARYRQVDNDRDLADALADFYGSGVLKTRRLGYDGKGQRRFHGRTVTLGTYEEMGSVPLILEEFVPFECEFSIVAARGRDAALRAFEPSRNVHHEGLLRTATVPARIPEAAAATARDLVFQLANSLDYVGVLCVEFFLLADGRVIANEFAPRVHNSGHWTEAACAISQFDQHIRAIASLPLGETESLCPCEMHNLIGEEARDVTELARRPDVLIHLYGKSEPRAGRKMGHYTRLLRADRTIR